MRVGVEGVHGHCPRQALPRTRHVGAGAARAAAAAPSSSSSSPPGNTGLYLGGQHRPEARDLGFCVLGVDGHPQVAAIGAGVAHPRHEEAMAQERGGQGSALGLVLDAQRDHRQESAGLGAAEAFGHAVQGADVLMQALHALGLGLQ